MGATAVLTSRVVRLDGRHVADLSALLDADPVATAYLRSELRRNLAAGEWWGTVADNRLRAAVLSGGLAVPWIPHRDDAAPLARALYDRNLRMVVGPRASVNALRDAIAAWREPRRVLDPQPVFVCTSADVVMPGITANVRRATRDDLDELVVAAAAMHREEMGVDPMAVDPAAWRQRMTTLVDEGWSWIWMEGGTIIFKCELSAWTPECAQLQGVYTAPRFRHRGLGRAGLAHVVNSLLGDAAACSLHVNHYNTAALNLYASLGFRAAGDFATVVY